MVKESCEERHRREPGVVDYLRVIERLNDPDYVQKKMVSLERGYNPAKPWVENAESQHRLKPFRAIVATSNPNKNPDVLISADIDDRCELELWKVANQDNCERTPEAMARHAEMLLRMSDEIVFVDPYFDFVNWDRGSKGRGEPDDRFTDTLKELIKCSFKGEYPKVIKLHARHRNDPEKDKEQSLERWRKDCSVRLPKLLREGASIEVYKWQKIFVNNRLRKRLHPRFVLTEQGGIYYEGGLDRDSTGGDETMVINLSDDLYKKTWRDFQVESTPFRLVDRIEVDFEGNVEVFPLHD
jgi:hypothetical protein